MKGNSFFVVGNITRDAEERATQSGRTVFSWGVAWNSARKDGQTGEWEDVPHYFDCKCWCSERQARAVRPLLVKGAKCAVSGHLEQERWEKDGQPRSRVVLVVEDPIGGMVCAAPGNAGGGGGQPGASPCDEDLPF